MTLDEYKRFYIDFVVTVLDPAVKREASCDLKLQADPARQAEYENLKNGLVILALVSFIESNFLTKQQMRQLRQFRSCTSPMPTSINPTHISCFIYIRDCIAHGPSAQLLSNGLNTESFLSVIKSGQFPWASVTSATLDIGGAHELHLNVLRFFGETV